MSFSHDCKSEMCKTPIAGAAAARAELYGALLLGFAPRDIAARTGHADIAERLRTLMRVGFGRDFEAERKGTRILLTLPQNEEILNFYGADKLSVHLNRAVLDDEELSAELLRGAFLTGGNVTSAPNYHLEFETPYAALSRELSALLGERDLPPKTALRAGHHVLYYKSTEMIEDFLVMLGAPQAAMALMNTKAEKSIRNKVNREVNCETANSARTVRAALEQTEAFERVKASELWDELPEGLRAAARARLEFPEETLSELAGRLGITKSGLNHRLRKLMELSKND
ncbi:putative sporulation transcription regulator WhiA [Clostridia bacterium]|nr:putative sporulation transcription regulator WhiA [Clostridia bacterium]